MAVSMIMVFVIVVIMLKVVQISAVLQVYLVNCCLNCEVIDALSQNRPCFSQHLLSIRVFVNLNRDRTHDIVVIQIPEVLLGNLSDSINEINLPHAFEYVVLLLARWRLL
jgi:hypothetical protein